MAQQQSSPIASMSQMMLQADMRRGMLILIKQAVQQLVNASVSGPRHARTTRATAAKHARVAAHNAQLKERELRFWKGIGALIQRLSPAQLPKALRIVSSNSKLTNQQRQSLNKIIFAARKFAIDQRKARQPQADVARAVLQALQQVMPQALQARDAALRQRISEWQRTSGQIGVVHRESS
ncbi:hypothetical protein GQ607_013958 [Colletotrichum asianum]|uniref:Uncharacterized protein n=1 Tax=Colletotrichum asianum TaxID=702518 RepID=A0A8H3VYD1_9PEZI|nr:hypothetical protein GQ607_013958 [Colletotrichum asianum]